MSFKKILIPLDGSQLAEIALQYVKHVAAPGAEIHLLSVMVDEHLEQFVSIANSVEIAFAGAPAYPTVPNTRSPEAISELKRYLERASEPLLAQGYSVKYEVLPGSVTETIVDVSRNEFDLILMATHGRTGLSKLVLGSIAEAVLHKASLPVLLIPVQKAL